MTSWQQHFSVSQSTYKMFSCLTKFVAPVLIKTFKVLKVRHRSCFVEQGAFCLRPWSRRERSRPSLADICLDVVQRRIEVLRLYLPLVVSQETCSKCHSTVKRIYEGTKTNTSGLWTGDPTGQSQCHKSMF